MDRHDLRRDFGHAHLRSGLADAGRVDVADPRAGPGKRAYYYALTLPTLWFLSVSEIGITYIRVQKRSGVFVILSLVRLLISVSLNVYFIVVLKMGVAGLLLGNLVASVMMTIAATAMMCASRWPYAFDLNVLDTFGGLAAR